MKYFSHLEEIRSHPLPPCVCFELHTNERFEILLRIDKDQIFFKENTILLSYFFLLKNDLYLFMSLV